MSSITWLGALLELLLLDLGVPDSDMNADCNIYSACADFGEVLVYEKWLIAEDSCCVELPIQFL